MTRVEKVASTSRICSTRKYKVRHNARAYVDHTLIYVATRGPVLCSLQGALRACRFHAALLTQLTPATAIGRSSAAPTRTY